MTEKKVSISWVILALLAGFTLALGVIGQTKAESENIFAGMIIRSQADKINTQASYIKQLETKLNNSQDLLYKCDKRLYIPN